MRGDQAEGKWSRIPDGACAGPENLEGSVILVTGATGGIGQVATRALADSGATLIILARTIARLEKLHDEILSETGVKPILHPLDLAGAAESDFGEMASAIQSEFGRLDGIFHAAAELGDLRPLGEIETVRWHRLITVNMTAPIMLTRALLPVMTNSGGGQVIFTDDSAAGPGKPFWGAYGIAKAGLRHYSAMLEAEMSGFGIRARCYSPGPVRTNIRLKAYAGELPDSLALPESKTAEIKALFSSLRPEQEPQGRIARCP